MQADPATSEFWRQATMAYGAMQGHTILFLHFYHCA